MTREQSQADWKVTVAIHPASRCSDSLVQRYELLISWIYNVFQHFSYYEHVFQRNLYTAITYVIPNNCQQNRTIYIYLKHERHICATLGATWFTSEFRTLTSVVIYQKRCWRSSCNTCTSVVAWLLQIRLCRRRSSRRSGAITQGVVWEGK